MSDLLFGMTGAFLSGLVLGFYGCRHLQRWMSGHINLHRGPCATCGAEGFLFTCRRCRRQFASCHSYHLILRGSPDVSKIQPRPSWDVCSDCVRDDERRLLESRGS